MSETRICDDVSDINAVMVISARVVDGGHEQNGHSREGAEAADRALLRTG